ncbi:MAG: endonuclease/exonuclease/phosphatase family protein [Planctomycetaceae bacterium]|nr:endonuclease/exonuclease/phosphatase family protein [Planctomycetaceae bacterium]
MSDTTDEAVLRGHAASAGFLRPMVNWLSAAVAAGSMTTLFARHWWIADLIANLRVQLILGLLGTLLLLLIMRHWRMAMIIIALAIWQTTALHSAFLSPGNTFGHLSSAADPNSEPLIRVFLDNVLTHNQNHDQVIAQILAAGPDVIAILELNSDLEKALNQQLATSHPYVVSESQDNGNFGIGLWSRFPLSNERVFHLNTPILPSIEADVQLPSQAIHLVVTHPLPPIGARNFNHRNRHLALLGQRIQKQFRRDSAESLILLGDLNLTPWSPLFHDFLAATDLQNAAAGRGLQPTWYRWNAFPFGLILDHGLHSGNLRCQKRMVLPPNGSDHRALVLDFSASDLN